MRKPLGPKPKLSHPVPEQIARRKAAQTLNFKYTRKGPHITLQRNQEPFIPILLGIRPWGVELFEEMDELDQTLDNGAAIRSGNLETGTPNAPLIRFA